MVAWRAQHAATQENASKIHNTSKLSEDLHLFDNICIIFKENADLLLQRFFCVYVFCLFACFVYFIVFCFFTCVFFSCCGVLRALGHHTKGIITTIHD